MKMKKELKCLNKGLKQNNFFYQIFKRLYSYLISLTTTNYHGIHQLDFLNLHAYMPLIRYINTISLMDLFQVVNKNSSYLIISKKYSTKKIDNDKKVFRKLFIN